MKKRNKWYATCLVLGLVLMVISFLLYHPNNPLLDFISNTLFVLGGMVLVFGPLFYKELPHETNYPKVDEKTAKLLEDAVKKW